MIQQKPTRGGDGGRYLLFGLMTPSTAPFIKELLNYGNTTENGTETRDRKGADRDVLRVAMQNQTLSVRLFFIE